MSKPKKSKKKDKPSKKQIAARKKFKKAIEMKKDHPNWSLKTCFNKVY